jgi:hypothetical protein
MVPNATILQQYCNLCNYIETIFSNIGEWSNATILQLMQLYFNLCNNLCNYIATYATILQQFRMQLYATMQLMQLYCNNFVCNYMQLCNMQLMKLQQLYGTYATLHNLWNLCNYATICNLCNYATICNYMTDRCGNFNFMQLYATMLVLYCNLCNYIAT